MTESRKLAAILAADVVGFSRLTGVDEDRTLARLRALRSDLIDPAISVHNGRIVKRTGDGVLVEFRSVVDAVRCATEIQTAMVERNAGLPPDRKIELRIGIHLGDVVEESDGDLMGDGVNIAARLEGSAAAGAICLSEDAYRQVKSRLDVGVSDLGETKFKNIVEPMRVYSLQVGSKPGAQVAKPATLSLPDKPSIAVLPFADMSGDPDQEFFSDGITEDIITELSRYKSLFVVARNSSFVFRGRPVDVREVGSKLGVLYVLEGSVRKAGSHIRVVAQLISAVSGEHIWADRYDGDLVDVFALQDEISRTIVSTIAGRLEESQVERLKQNPTHDLSAYEHVLRGQKCLHRYTQSDYERGRDCFERAIEADANFARAHALLAVVEAYCWFWDIVPSRLASAVSIGENALALDPHESKCHLALGVAHLFRATHDRAGYHLMRGSELNPNDDLIMVELGRHRLYVGQPDDGAHLIRQAMRRNPYHPNWYWNVLGRCLHTAGEFEAAIPIFEHVTSPQFWTHAYLAACYAAVGNSGKAGEHRAKTLAMRPDFTVSGFMDTLPYRDQSDRLRFLESLRGSGLPH